METITNKVIQKILSMRGTNQETSDISFSRETNNCFLVAIDGRCASGKTTLAADLQKKLDCTVFHMDDYFLRPEQRTFARLNTAGGNIDYERFQEEILLPLRAGSPLIRFQAFHCQTQTLSEVITIQRKPLCIVEGSYSCHPFLRDKYDLRIFLTLNPEEQMRRIASRNGVKAASVFQEKWIPLEEKYFSACAVKQACEMCFQTDTQPY